MKIFFHSPKFQLALLLLCFTTPYPAFAVEHSKEPVDVIKALIENGKAVLIDVREPAERKVTMVKGSKSVPMSKINSGKYAGLLKNLKKDVILYTHCGAGFRALKAVEPLEKLGYKVKALKWGPTELIKAGF